MALITTTTNFKIPTSQDLQTKTPTDPNLPLFGVHETYIGDNEPILCVKVFDDRVYGACVGGNVIAWDRLFYQRVFTYKGHEADVNSIATYYDQELKETFIITASNDKSVGIFVKSSSVPLYTIEHSCWVTAVVVEEEHIYSGDSDGTIFSHKWFHDKSKAPVFLRKLQIHKSKITAMHYNDDYIFTSSADSTIHILGKQGFVPVKYLTGHEDIVYDISLCSEYIYSVSRDSTTRVWKLNEGEVECFQTTGSFPMAVTSSKKSGKFYSGTYSGLIEYYTNDKKIQTLKVPSPARIYSLAIEDNILFAALSNGNIQTWTSLPPKPKLIKTIAHSIAVDERYVYTGSVDGSLCIWDKKVQYNNPSNLYQTYGKINTFTGCSRDIRYILVTDDRIYTASKGDSFILVREKKTGDILTQLNSYSHISSILVDEAYIYTCTTNAVLSIWNKDLRKIKDEEDIISPLTEISLPSRASGSKSYPRKVVVYEGHIFVSDVTMLVIYDKKDFQLVKILKHEQLILGLCFYNNPESKQGEIYYTTENGTVYIWSLELDPVKKFKRKYFHKIQLELPPNGYLQSLQVEMSRIYGGNSYEMFIFDMKGKILKSEIRKFYTEKMIIDEGKRYDLSENFVFIQNLEYLNMLPFHEQCLAIEVLNEQDCKTKAVLDSEDRNGLMFCATVGSIKNGLLLSEQYSLFQVSKYGESAIFFALREEKWEFLNAFKKSYSYFNIEDDDHATYQLLINRAKAGDVKFFKKFLELGLYIGKNEVLGAAIQNNHVWFCENWKSIYLHNALHLACYYGRPDCVKALLNRRRIHTDKSSPHYFQSNTSLHICHMNADFSAYNSSRCKKEHVPKYIWDKLEYDLILKRTECFEAFCNIKEVTKKPNYKAKNMNGRTPYDEALNLHNITLQAMKAPKKEIEDRIEIMHRNRLYYETDKVLDWYQERPEIDRIRERFAMMTFVKESIGYLVFLILLTTVGLLMSTNGQRSVYDLNSALSSYLIGDNFSNVVDEASFWNYLNDDFLPTIFQNGNASDGYIMGFNQIIGAIQLRQLKVKENSCKSRSLYAPEATCYSPQFSASSQETAPFGPDKKWVYEHKAGDRYWTESDSTWLPSGGYIANIPTDTLENASDALSNLQTNDWITPGTRYVLVSMNIYNGNETGLFGVLRLEFSFTATGVVKTMSDVSIWGPNGYDLAMLPSGYIKIILQFIVTFYVLYAFVYTEISEIRQEINKARKYNISTEEIHNNPVWKGLKEYFSQLWNFYEWGMIIIFLFIFGMEISVIAGFARLNLYPDSHTYVDLQSITTVSNFEIDLLALFILMNWMRLLKYLRIPKFTGPMVQSVMDTLQSSTVLVFVFIVFYVVLSFSLCYHIAFGPDIPDYATYAESAISIFQSLFGGPDYGALLDSNKVFGPVLFVVFMLFTIVLLMNLLIGVLGDAYDTAQKANLEIWNRYITRLMIETLPSRCISEEVDIWEEDNYSIWERIKSIFSSVKNEKNLHSIYYDDDELDNMVCGEEKGLFKAQVQGEIIALEAETKPAAKEEKTQDQEMMERIQNLEKMISQLLQAQNDIVNK